VSGGTRERAGWTGGHPSSGSGEVAREGRGESASAAGEEAGPKLVCRICQVLVLPPFQGSGHGARLVRAVNKHAREAGAYEITVEDPSPKFRALRDLVDVRECLERGFLLPGPGTDLPDAAWEEARSALRITREQLSRCAEILRFRSLHKQVVSSNAETAELLVKPFRLTIKRRLNKKHKEELDTLQGDARKARLELLYQSLMDEYTALLKRLPTADPPSD